MGLWPLSAMVVAPELLERKWHWMRTRSTSTMIAICSNSAAPLGACGLSTLRPSSIARRRMRKIRNITTMDKQERYFHNSLGHPSLPTALIFLADPRALIRSISRGIACCSTAFFMPTPVTRERSTAVSPAGPRSDRCTWHVAAWLPSVRNDLRPHGCGKPVAAMACDRWLRKASGCNGVWPPVVERSMVF